MLQTSMEWNILQRNAFTRVSVEVHVQKCDAELAELQESLEVKGITDISEDAKLNDLVRNYLNQDNNSVPMPGEEYERTEGILMPLQGDIAVVEEGQVPD